MIGDYYRYLVEYFPKANFAEKSRHYYTKAWELCQKSNKILHDAHPIRLGVRKEINFCVHNFLGRSGVEFWCFACGKIKRA